MKWKFSKHSTSNYVLTIIIIIAIIIIITRRPHPDTLESGPQLGLGCHGRGHPSSVISSQYINYSRCSGGSSRNQKTSQVPGTLQHARLHPINNTGMDLISDLARDLTRSTGDPRESSFLFQRLSISVQRFNAVAFRGTFTDSENRDYNTMTIV